MNEDKQNSTLNNEDVESLKNLEKASLSTLVLSLSSSAVVHMGLEPSMKEKKNLQIAQFNIDMLDILKQKTENNRTEQESALLENCIKDLKSNFIQVSKKS